MVGSALVLVLVFERLSGLHTLETRTAIEKFLAEPPGDDLGIGVGGVQAIIRTLAMVTAGCATAAGILGFQVLKRSRSARLALTVLAVPLFLAGTVTGGFLTSLVAASALMLWLQPARDWFDGVSPAQRSVPALPQRPAPPTIRSELSVEPPVGPRPAPVTLACVLTWAACGLTAVGSVLTGVLLLVRPDTLLDEVHRQNPELEKQGVADDVLISVTIAMLVAVVVWSLGSAFLGFLVFRGLDWARVLLVISAATAGAFSLVAAAVGAFLLVVTLVASTATVALLVRRDVRPWFRT